MRLAPALAIGLLLATAAQTAAAAAPLLTGATGTVTRLDLTRITVNHTTCSVGGRGAARAGGFAVGEHVSIGCVHGVLRRITLAPLLTGSGHALPMLQSSMTVPATRQGSSKLSLAWSGGTVTLGTSDGGSLNSVSATGPISSLDATEITVAGVSCPFFAANLSGAGDALAQKLAAAPYGVYQTLTQHGVSVGDTAALSCTFSNSSVRGRIDVA